MRDHGCDVICSAFTVAALITNDKTEFCRIARSLLEWHSKFLFLEVGTGMEAACYLAVAL